MSQMEESRSDRSSNISKKENKIGMFRISDFSTKNDNKSTIQTAKISFNSPLYAQIKVKQSERVLQNRPRFDSSTVRPSDKLS